jgi:hypothetical protein
MQHPTGAALMKLLEMSARYAFAGFSRFPQRSKS